jgi:phosphoribosylformylglycinamidine synthase
MHRLIRGIPPALDLAREAALQRLLVTGAASGLIRSAHDCAEGGLAVTLAESSFDTQLGLEADVPSIATSAPSFSDTVTLFGESASRAIVSVASNRVDELLAAVKAENVPARVIGRVGGDRIRISIAGRLVIDEPLVEAERIWATAIETHFERRGGTA